MGAVYRVEHSHTQECYALKLIRGDLIGDEEEQLRFRREVELVALLDHPHVVRLRDFSFTTSSPYQVYDLYEGGTLQARIAREGKLPLDVALTLTRKLGEGLAHAHDQGVLHRDLKPDNVLLDSSGEPALADFGLARQDRGQSRDGLTATGETIGTPVYMAPEQAIDSKRVDARADLYGLAAICYAMLTGGPPVVGAKTILEAFDKVLHEPPPSIGRQDVPPGIERVVLRGLAKDPAERPADVRAFLASLARGEEARASRVPFVAGIGVVSLLLVTGVVAWALGPAPAVPSPSAVASPVPGLRVLSRKEGSWGWLTLTPAKAEKGAGLSLLVACSTEGEVLRVGVLRARGLEAGTVWDTIWSSGKRLKAMTDLAVLAEFNLNDGASVTPASLEAVELAGPQGVLLRESLKGGGLGEIFRLLADSPARETGVRVVRRGGETYAWEPVVWSGGLDWARSDRLDLHGEPSARLRQKIADALPTVDLGPALAEVAWPGLLTHNRSRALDEPFPDSSLGPRYALVVPQATSGMAESPQGSLRLSPRTAVFAHPDGLLLGLSSEEDSRLLVFGQRPDWIQIGWGGVVAGFVGWPSAPIRDLGSEPGPAASTCASGTTRPTVATRESGSLRPVPTTPSQGGEAPGMRIKWAKTIAGPRFNSTIGAGGLRPGMRRTKTTLATYSSSWGGRVRSDPGSELPADARSPS